MKENDMIKVHLYSGSCGDGREIITRKFNEIFKVKKINGKLGIDWNTEKSPYTCRGEIFTPFETFAQTVIFENVESGEKFRWDNISGGIVKIA